ncbi:hypothetical protein ACFRDV_02800 [Streptomyces fagopyri]|uniref:IS1 family transposase n=1 Tax=Streptomyces fagopyri TaxID=2662397 RepID=A0A5Q0LA01_9ACTN|nr:hypothetical protein [Streptomyces fagopyri]QFZ73654.1 hypothetical protein GFH48_10745 [Streptomyces fagopyri]
MSERAAPFYCPYCGDEDLRPSEQGHGAWECAACNRAFQLKFLGLLAQGVHRTPRNGNVRPDEGGGDEI